jgi:hypothetical protein
MSIVMTNPGLGKVEADLKTTGLKLEDMVSRIEKRKRLQLCVPLYQHRSAHYKKKLACSGSGDMM